MSEYKDCPYCAEKILAKAVKCKHCQSTIEEALKTGSQTGEFSGAEKKAEAAAPPPPPAPPSMPAAKKPSSLKTVGIVIGSIVGLVIIGFIVMVAYYMINPQQLEVVGISTAASVTDEGKPIDPADTFYPDVGAVYVSLDIENAPSDTTLTASWYYEDEDYFIDSASIGLPPGDSTPYFFYLLDDYWPDGSYRVDLSIEDEIIASVRFQVVIETGTISHTWEGISGEYSGQLRSGIPHGEGSWSNDQKTAEYIGEWAYGLPDGFGALYSDIFSYEGEWFEGNFHGQGTFVLYGEFSYTGGFRNDTFHGEGVITFEDGTVIKGTFEDGEKVD